MKFFPLYPLPPFQCWLKNGQRLAQYILHHLVNIGLGGGGEGPIYFVSACQMMNFSQEFCPRLYNACFHEYNEIQRVSMTKDTLICRSRESPHTDVVECYWTVACGFMGTKRYLDVYRQMKTIVCMTVLKVVDYSTYYCKRVVMD